MGKPVFYVVIENQEGTLLKVIGKGDRAKARKVAGDALDDGEEEIKVLRVTEAITLTPESLVAALPKDAI